MNIASVVKDALIPFGVVMECDGQVVVPTHCLYPSNSAVTVYVSGGRSDSVVSDEGGAIDELSTHNRVVADPDRYLRKFCRPAGLVSSQGKIQSMPLNPAQILSAVLLVANTSAAAAHWGLEHLKHRRLRNLRKDLLGVLQGRYSKERIELERKLHGKSTRSYKFSSVVHIDADRLLVIDAVMPDANSVNSHAIAHMDLAQLQDDHIVQRIVYDDRDEWRPGDLNLLQMAATLVPFSRIDASLDRFRV